MNSHPDTVLILGIGNLLWADEGFGVRCVEALGAQWCFPDWVTVMDGGTQGMYLLPYVTASKRMIIFDAVDYGLPAATLQVIENESVPRFMGAKKMSLHQTGFQEVLAAADLLGQLPREMLLIGVQPEELDDYGGSLRPAVLAQVSNATSIALARLRQWQVPLLQRVGRGAELTDAALSLERYVNGRPDPASACRIGDERILAGRGR